MKVSIVTINYNNKAGLERTIQSVFQQAYANIEYIVVDGDSTDGSKEVINNNKNKIDKIVIEKDDGLYEAMNKGIALATGDYIMFLNSGDWFRNKGSLELFFSKITDKNKYYFARMSLITKSGHSYSCIPNKKFSTKYILKNIKYSLPGHQASLFPKLFYTKNLYNLQYKIVSDVDYKLRAIDACEVYFIDQIFVNFEMGGVSTPRSYKQMFNTLWEIIKVYYSNEGWKLKNIWFILTTALLYSGGYLKNSFWKPHI